jgi:hypothetical protein
MFRVNLNYLVNKLFVYIYLKNQLWYLNYIYNIYTINLSELLFTEISVIIDLFKRFIRF